jgi:hypothetical protein
VPTSRKNWWGCGLGLIGALLLSGCISDIFGDRAVAYNEEAESHKDKVILSNIGRAALGRSLQFTELSTVSGTASQSIQLGGSIPLVGGPPTVSHVSTLSPTLGLSGGPTFNVANLSTKEFYSGILAPLPLQTIGYYLLEGYPAQILLPLVISDITYGPKEKSQRIHNGGRTLDGFNDFYTALNGLMALGLTAESVGDATSEGPALTDADAKNPRLLASLAAGAAAGNATLDLKRYDVNPTDPAKGDANLSKAEQDMLVAKGAKYYFRLEKKGTKYRFCFSPAVIGDRPLPIATYLAWTADANGKPQPIPDSKIMIGRPSLCGAKSLAAPEPNAPSDSNVKGLENLSFEPRSVEGIFYFLGDIVRSNITPMVFDNPRGGGQVVLFKASESRSLGGESISVNVSGHVFSISVDPAGHDYSSRVVQLLSELIALNSSAKDLPTPNVISVITP